MLIESVVVMMRGCFLEIGKMISYIYSILNRYDLGDSLINTAA